MVKIYDGKKVEQDAMKLLITKRLKTAEGEFTITGKGPYQLNRDGIKVCALSPVVTTAVDQILRSLKEKVSDAVALKGSVIYGTNGKLPSKDAIKVLDDAQYEAFTKRIKNSITGVPGTVTYVATFNANPSMEIMDELFGKKLLAWNEVLRVDDQWLAVGEIRM